MSIYYVATTGNDGNAGTIGSPWLTISYGVAQLVAGDTLYIRAGTYTSSSNIIDSALSTVPSGTSWSAPITIAGYPSETVTIQPPDNKFAIGLRTNSEHYLIFSDLILDGINDVSSDGTGVIYINGGAHHILFQDMEIKNGWGNGICTSAHNGLCDHIDILRSSIHDNGRDTSISGYRHGMYLDHSDSLIDGCYVYANNGYGIQLDDNGPDNPANTNVSRYIIRNNSISHNRLSSTAVLSTNGGIVLSQGGDNLVYNNQIYDNGQGGATGSDGHGILVYSNAKNNKIYNNTIYNNTGNGIALQYYDTGNLIRNNIVYGHASGNIVDYGGSIGGATYTASNNLTTDPSFVDVTGSTRDLRLQSGSAAIDAGMTLSDVPNDYAGITRPQGSAYDIGAVEFVTATGGTWGPLMGNENNRLARAA